MPLDTDNLEARIDREKRQREDALLVFLLSLFLRARSHADLALRLGANPLAAVRDVLIGNTALGLPGGAYRLAQAMAESEALGFRRVLRVLNGRERIVTQVETKPSATHLSLARQHMAKMLGTLQGRVYLALGQARGTAEARKAVAETFETWGYIDPAFNAAGVVHSATSKAWMLANVAETVIGIAYNGGMMGGYQTPDAADVITALRFTTVRDERRTEICRIREGVTLPLDDPWWFSNWAPLHFGCRSLALPLTGHGVKFTENPPVAPPPDPGWGQWAGMLSAFTQTAAA